VAFGVTDEAMSFLCMGIEWKGVLKKLINPQGKIALTTPTKTFSPL